MDKPLLLFLKLGGSLITDKNQISSPRMDIIKQIAREISDQSSQTPHINLLIGHGSGSFGHVPGKKYNTRQGVSSSSDWKGFTEVWREARRLNQIVSEALMDAGLPVIAFPPSAIYCSSFGKVKTGFINNIQSAITHGIIPLVNGDVIFDDTIGGTILSTEEIFSHLASKLHPDRILLAGIEKGVWEDFPVCKKMIPVITPYTYNGILAKLGGSIQVDVTGGMLAKVDCMLNLIKKDKNIEALIFSGEQKGNITSAFLDTMPGTIIRK